jgi:uncharacterized protein (TIGR03118 family)
LPGAFVDPNLPKGFAPLGIQTIGSRVFVTYDLNGAFLHCVATRGTLDAPWGIAQAPAGWGALGGDLLIGNFGNGKIHAFKELGNTDFKKDGALRDASGKKLAIDGLWALEFGNAGANGNPQTLFFTAGPNDENDGLFGTITPS